MEASLPQNGSRATQAGPGLQRNIPYIFVPAYEVPGCHHWSSYKVRRFLCVPDKMAISLASEQTDKRRALSHIFTMSSRRTLHSPALTTLLNAYLIFIVTQNVISHFPRFFSRPLRRRCGANAKSESQHRLALTVNDTRTHTTRLFLCGTSWLMCVP